MGTFDGMENLEIKTKLGRLFPNFFFLDMYSSHLRIGYFFYFLFFQMQFFGSSDLKVPQNFPKIYRLSTSVSSGKTHLWEK